jgi:vanillate O-demethylase monooxygenase subunit
VRNFRPDCAATDRALTDDFISAFNEDLVVLSAVDDGMTNKRTPNTDIETDAAPLRFRRMLQKMIEAERAPQQVVS